MVDVPTFVIDRAKALGGIPHGFFGSSDGAFQFGYGGPGKYAAVHMARADAANAVQAGGRIVAPHQVHSADVITVKEPWEDTAEGRPVADALVTAAPGLVLAIVTADCAPVLLADPEASVVGAAHAGWRGAQGGILENTIKAMEQIGANRSRICAAIGPTIAGPSYEVDEAFRAHFSTDDAAHFSPAPAREGKARWHFDLTAYCAAKLTGAEVSIIEDVARDTYAEAARYYSYRRASQTGQPNYGRQISMIGFE
ncbi:peptidoglycan editing factor PgeF [Erythrobacter insulae]|uniref:Purine nucleoside phosphorylase n=1 Tax=Erythrobacter insulae TaxID=2584124 RepID=A0A547PBE1_9SPHN|nr:peptidoglycan editing factor PgeF [Erythrobacter insulae]TRD11462.1 peptidoglycan editing factor PgeF [Erythrobacter insulae]